jgi:hypothetical protein
MDREQNAMGLLARGSFTREVKRKARGELTQGENSKPPFFWPTCPKCKQQYPGICWSEMTCNVCGRKGHPDYKCHDKEPHSSAMLVIQDIKGGIRGFTPAFDLEQSVG